MTWGEFGATIRTTGLRAAYHHFNTPQKLPFIVFAQDGRDDLNADNTHYVKIIDGYVELYTDTKQPDLEESIETTLAEHQIPYSWENEIYIDSEKIYMVRWAINFIGGKTYGE